jgi:hypothetical protein
MRTVDVTPRYEDESDTPVNPRTTGRSRSGSAKAEEIRQKLQDRRSQRQSRPGQESTRTGHGPTDDRRSRIKSFDDKADKPVGADVGATFGDFIEGLVKRLLSPTTMMFLGYVGAGVCLTVSVTAYSRILIPALSGALPLGFDWLAGAALSLTLGMGLQALEIFPSLHIYFPDLAERLAVKLKLNPVVNPREDRNSPSLLPIMSERVKKAHEQIFADMGRVGIIAYGIEALGSLWAFQLFTAAGTLNVPGVVAAITAIVGFEVCVKFSTMMKQIRLTSRESRKYREHKRKIMQDSATDLNR